MDFVSECLHNGRRFRALTIGDNVSRAAPSIVVGRSLTEQRVVDVPEDRAPFHGLPKMIQVVTLPRFDPKALLVFRLVNMQNQPTLKHAVGM